MIRQGNQEKQDKWERVGRMSDYTQARGVWMWRDGFPVIKIRDGRGFKCQASR